MGRPLVLTLLVLEGDTGGMSAARIFRNAWWWRTP